MKTIDNHSLSYLRLLELRIRLSDSVEYAIMNSQ